MALVLNDRVKETTTTTGTGTFTLAGAVTGFETFGTGVGNSNTTYYAVTLPGSAEFEVGLGTLSSDSSTLARTTVISSSNSDNAVNFSAGTKTIFCTLPASKTVFLDASGNATLGADLSVGDDLTVEGGVIAFKSNSGSPASLRMYCEVSNAHYQTLQPQPHSAAAANTLRLPDSGDSGTQDLVAVDITQTLTNKTLTSPTINGFSGTGDASITGDFTLTSTDATNVDGPIVKLTRNSASPAVNDILGSVRFLGKNDAAQDVTYAEIDSIIFDETDGTENGALRFTVPNNGTQTVYQTLGDNKTLFNQKAVFIDNVEAKFGTDSDGEIKFTGSNFQINNTTGDLQFSNFANDKDVDIRTDDGSGSTALYFKADGSTGEALLYHYGTEKIKTTSDGATVTGDLTTTADIELGHASDTTIARASAGVVTIEGNTIITTGNSDTPTTTTSSSDADFVLVDDGGTMKKITPTNLGIGSGASKGFAVAMAIAL